MEQDKTALMCPRCSSTNTKFRYYNNHSLSQPRHYCRDCKRLWTVGGNLRAIPVGGTARIKETNALGSKCGCSRSQPQPQATPTTFHKPITNFGNVENQVGFGSSDTNSLQDWNVQSRAPKQAFSQQVVGSYQLPSDSVQPTLTMGFAHQEAINSTSFSRTNIDLPSSSVDPTQWREFPGFGHHK